MDTNLNVEEVFELWALLHQSSDSIARARQKELREVGVSMIQSALLFVVRSIEGPATPAEISRRIFREPHTVFELLQQMEKKGLLRRVKDLERKNMVRIVLTEKGEETYHRSRDKREAVCQIMSCLSQQERANLRAYLQKVRGKALATLGVKHQLFPF